MTTLECLRSVVPKEKYTKISFGEADTIAGDTLKELAAKILEKRQQGFKRLGKYARESDGRFSQWIYRF